MPTVGGKPRATSSFNYEICSIRWSASQRLHAVSAGPRGGPGCGRHPWTLTAAWWRPCPEPSAPQRMQFVIEPPPQSAFASGAISPDGRQLAFFRVDTHDTTELWTRPLDALEARRVDGTRGAAWQFWSPDGRAIGFFAGRLKTITASGGAAVDGVSALRRLARAGVWTAPSSMLRKRREDSIVVGQHGRAASQLTTPASTSGEISHRWPHFCRTGDVTCSCPGIAEPARRALYVGFLNGEAPRRLGSIESAAVFAPPHYVLWTSGTLFARRFDLETLEFSGVPRSSQTG